MEDFLKKYWYIIAGGVLLLVFLLRKPTTGVVPGATGSTTNTPATTAVDPLALEQLRGQNALNIAQLTQSGQLSMLQAQINARLEEDKIKAAQTAYTTDAQTAAQNRYFQYLQGQQDAKNTQGTLSAISNALNGLFKSMGGNSGTKSGGSGGGTGGGGGGWPSSTTGGTWNNSVPDQTGYISPTDPYYLPLPSLGFGLDQLYVPTTSQIPGLGGMSLSDLAPQETVVDTPPPPGYSNQLTVDTGATFSNQYDNSTYYDGSNTYGPDNLGDVTTSSLVDNTSSLNYDSGGGGGDYFDSAGSEMLAT